MTVVESTITPDEALAILRLEEHEVPALVARAHEVRLANAGAEVEVESIISAKTGGCPEDCSFCSQSRHWPTPVRPEPFIDIPPLVEAAKRAQDAGATEFCIVAALRGPDQRMIDQVIKATDLIDRETGLLAAPGAPGAAIWFKKGSAPTDVAGTPGTSPTDFGRTSREF